MSQPSESFESKPRLSLAREIDFRPLVLPACAFIAGILAHEYLPVPNLPVIVGACVLAALVPVIYFFTRWKVVLAVLVLVLACACGYLRAAYHGDVLACDDLSRLVPGEGALLRVRGVVSTRPLKTVSPADDTFRWRDSLRTRFHIDVDSVETKTGWQGASGTVQVSVYDDASDFAYGDRVEILSHFTRPETPTSPGQFDYRTYLLRNGIRLRTGLGTREAVQRLEQHRGHILIELSHGIGTRLARIINTYHPDPRDAGFLRCILLGERGAVDPETELAFRLSGLSHLLTVSGLHVVALMGGLWLVLRFFLVRERTIAAVVITLSLLYAALAEFQPSVVRAVVVMVIVASGVFIGRRHDMLSALAAASLLLLVANPGELFFAGFQLSFVSVLGLVGLAPGLYAFLKDRMGFSGIDLVPGAHHWLRVQANRFFIGAFAVSAAAWLASQPLVAYHFQVLNPNTVGLNLLLIPVFSVILLTAFFVLIIETVVGGFLVASVSDGLVKLLMLLSRTGSELPAAWVNVVPPPGWVLGVYYLLLLLAGVAPTLGLRRRWPAGLVLLFLLAFVGWQFLPARPDAPELVILDVGQGSAALVRTPEGHAALVDVGSSGGADVSRWTVIPYLVRSRIQLLDLVILSHADSDHTSGLPGLLDNFKVAKVLLGESFQCTMTGARVERFLIDRGVPFEYVAQHDVIRLGSVRLEVIHPPRDRPRIARWTENARSAVVRGVTESGTFILFADAEGSGFTYLAAHNDLTADVVLAAHHGGVSGMEKLASTCRWPVVLFSAERRFIKPERLEAFRSTGGRTFATGDSGTLTVRFGKTIEVETYQRGKGN
jgi:competence protein ComEC